MNLLKHYETILDGQCIFILLIKGFYKKVNIAFFKLIHRV